MTLRFSPAGDLEWAHSWGVVPLDEPSPDSNEIFLGAAVDSNGNLLVAGGTENELTYQQPFMMTIDPTGTKVNSSWFVTAEEMNITGLFVSGTGVVYACGNAKGLISGDPAVYAGRLDSQGSFEWITTWKGEYGYEYSENAYQLAIGNDGFLYLLGATSLLDGPNMEFYNYVMDPLLVRLDLDGALLDALVWPNEGETSIGAIAVTTAGLLLAGSTSTILSEWESVTMESGNLNSFNNMGVGYRGDLAVTVAPISGSEAAVEDGVIDTGGGSSDLLLMQLTSGGS